MDAGGNLNGCIGGICMEGTYDIKKLFKINLKNKNNFLTAFSALLSAENI